MTNAMSSCEAVMTGMRTFTRLTLRPDQKPPASAWKDWLILGGRGFGKTTAICGWLRDRVFCGPDESRWAIVGTTTRDARDILVEGCSGILASSPPWFMPRYYPTRRKLVWPNGAVGLVFSSEDSDQFRGLDFHGAICDEASRWDGFVKTYHELRSRMHVPGDRGWNPQIAWSMEDANYSVGAAGVLLGLPGTVVNPGSMVESILPCKVGV